MNKLIVFLLFLASTSFASSTRILDGQYISNAANTLTVPNFTGPLVGLDTTDTLTNKSMDGGANTFTNIPVGAIGNGTVLSGTNTGDLTLGTANGLSIINQILSLGLSSGSTTGALSSADWNTFNNKQAAGSYVTSVSGTPPIVSSGGVTPSISIPVATGAADGYLSSTDWNTFSGKVRGPPSSTATAVPRFGDTAGNTLTNSGVLIDGSDNVTGVNSLTTTLGAIFTDVVSIFKGSAPVASAALEIGGTTKGLLPPRLTTTQRDAISSPATGLLVYNTTTNLYNFYNGTAWTVVGSGGGGGGGSGPTLSVRCVNAAGYSIPNATTTLIDFDTCEFDPNAAVTTGGSWHFTVPPGFAGQYLVGGLLRPIATTTNVNWTFSAFINGSQSKVLHDSRVNSGSAQAPSVGGAVTLTLADGDQVDFRAYQDVGVTANVGSAPNENYVYIIRIADSTNFIGAKYGASTLTNTIPNSSAFTVIDYPTLIFDPNSAVTTGSSWKYTAPMAGKYRVHASFLTGGELWSGGDNFQFRVFKNGSSNSLLMWHQEQATATIQVNLVGEAIVDLVAGDYIDVEGSTNRTSGSISTIETSTQINQIDIQWVGF